MMKQTVREQELEVLRLLLASSRLRAYEERALEWAILWIELAAESGVEGRVWTI